MNIEEDYKILGVVPGTPANEIKRAFRQKAKVTHPDVNPSDTADAEFVQVNAAYERLVSEEAETREQVMPEYMFLYDLLRPETRQERALRYARQWQEEFKRNNEAFKHSAIYLPAKIGAYALWLSAITIALTFMFGPPVVSVFHDLVTGLSMTPVMVVGVAFLFGSMRFKQQMNRYL